jgi:hypothetical protein
MTDPYLEALLEAQQQIEILTAALKPFARHGELIAAEFADDQDDTVAAGFADDPITLGDFRRASAALTQSTAKGEGE